MNSKNSNIGYSDEYSEVDLLGGDIYYDGLTKFIMQCNTPMTISIQGDWGTGKTTALNLIQKKIEAIDKDRYQILWFRTWQYSKFGMEGNLALSLMLHLHSKLLEIAKNRNIKLKDSSFPVKKVFAELVTTTVDARMGGRMAEKADSFAKAMLGIDEIADAARELEQTKNKIQTCIDAIIEEDERLIIFIDDLDRLEPRISIELLECLKIFLDCKKCVFVLAVDSQVVFQGVKCKYGNDFGEDKARKFFDKIIQVPFNLPVNQYDLPSYLSQFLPGSNSDVVSRYCNVVTKLLNSNPRSIKRAFNLLALYEQIMSDLLRNPEDKLNLFSVILFQIRDENAYSRLVEAAKHSNDEVTAMLKESAYQCILDALALKDFCSDGTETNESLTTFIELLVSTSQISAAKQSDKPGESYTYSNPDERINDIISKVNQKLKKVQLNDNVINFADPERSGRKKCSFRINNGTLNIVVYSASPGIDLDLPNISDLLDKAEHSKVEVTQLGYYRSSDHITFVGVQECKNQDLIHDVLVFYNIYDS